jgi:PST family polysaccharide transporter
VGIYAGAERISKSILGLTGPISQALYPRMNALMRESPEKAALLARRVIPAMMLAAASLAAVLVIAAPLVVRITLGRGFEDSVAVLRLLALLVPLIAGSNLLGIQWMLPLRRDRAFNAIIICAGFLNVGLACLLAPILQAKGMALAVILAETFVTLGCFVYLQAQSLSPLSLGFRSHQKKIAA